MIKGKGLYPECLHLTLSWRTPTVAKWFLKAKSRNVCSNLTLTLLSLIPRTSLMRSLIKFCPQGLTRKESSSALMFPFDPVPHRRFGRWPTDWLWACERSLGTLYFGPLFHFLQGPCASVLASKSKHCLQTKHSTSVWWNLHPNLDEFGFGILP